eukprot:TRINITY_DN1288_c1_g3_i1.p1 TRINITY_DN1288_c1_g3~~TRINITY_DN1288_c1_g3_i1.p1  ORF type:complete len:366 (-),score=127.56 TRINITY_DN1288_c1_g3_i1:296-1393(-)
MSLEISEKIKGALSKAATFLYDRDESDALLAEERSDELEFEIIEQAQNLLVDHIESLCGLIKNVVSDENESADECLKGEPWYGRHCELKDLTSEERAVHVKLIKKVKKLIILEKKFSINKELIELEENESRWGKLPEIFYSNFQTPSKKNSENATEEDIKLFEEFILLAMEEEIVNSLLDRDWDKLDEYIERAKQISEGSLTEHSSIWIPKSLSEEEFNNILRFYHFNVDSNNNNEDEEDEEDKKEDIGVLPYRYAWGLVQGVKDLLIEESRQAANKIKEDSNIYKGNNLNQTEFSSLNYILVDENCKLHIVGDIHGQLFDLYTVLSKLYDGQQLPNDETKYLFNGDFIDRGSHQMEVLVILYAM